MNNLFRNITPVSRMVRKTFVLARYSTATGSKEYIESLVKGKKIVIFMKGTPDAPRCGFSNAVVTLLKYHGVLDYDAHNVLEDEDLRQVPPCSSTHADGSIEKQRRWEWSWLSLIANQHSHKAGVLSD
ncbi:hypothetical protein LSH36_313g04022 [Paralvinella palmiformis]|uniref:Glutaredoxin domain-containing protein n=1 Tax=Paralvinella palmiformis TaxID=53620 RepID=A0AAD9JIT9_9ANNE|nr:hypothetical protein LSH36_313g04022 [Paralvinella palmiformis]